MTSSSIGDAVLADLAELRLSGPRAHLALIAALSVGLAVLAALWLRLDAPWWAGISAFVCTQASQPASFAKAAERIAGTTLGAAVAFLMSPWLGEFPFLIPPVLLLCSMAAIIGGSVSRYSYTWLLGGITADMVVMGALANPMLVPSIAIARTVETALGAVAAVVVSSFLAEPGIASERPAAPGWSGLFGPNRHVLEHALRTGLAMMLVPLVWDWFELPGLDQMAISVAAVMAVSGLATKPEQAGAWVRQRVRHRIAGCVLGGVAGLAVLAAAFTVLVAWLAAVMIGVWIGTHLQATTRGISYVGQQATVAFILTLVQGAGPPLSPTPGLERLAGILLGVGLLFVVSAAWPAQRAALAQ